MYKICTRCNVERDLNSFNKSSKTKDGHVTICKCCKKIYREENKDMIKVQKDTWYDKNKIIVSENAKLDRAINKDFFSDKEARKYKKHRDKILKRVSSYQRENPEVNRRAAKKYRDANPEKGAAKSCRRRARKLQATPSWTGSEFEQFFLKEVYHLSKLRNELTNIVWHVDHVVPLKSKLVCGLHCQTNLEVIPKLTNLQKGNRWWPDMWE